LNIADKSRGGMGGSPFPQQSSLPNESHTVGIGKIMRSISYDLSKLRCVHRHLFLFFVWPTNNCN